MREENLNRFEDRGQDTACGDNKKRLAQGTISHVPGIVGLTAAGLIINDILSNQKTD